ncbi:hypothetical protein D9758_012422 [Tetrapyrgos nigripes]|uniref:MYND-type domain-containing protein n=1 Tax=Tetrapyrgos nigripes TaxID=182062 RepID=A0A8H5D854_9AGAR|nr:hypothetical protein D9758_012422 [Tetrapyrgos nigripes]
MSFAEGLFSAVQEDAKAISSNRSALLALRKSPPNIIDPDRPSSEVLNAMSALSAMIYFLHFSREPVQKAAVLDLQKHWSSHIYPWNSKLLESFIFSNKKPLTKEGLDIQEKLRWVVPAFTSFNAPHPAAAIYAYEMGRKNGAFHPKRSSLHGQTFFGFRWATTKEQADEFDAIMAAIQGSIGSLLQFLSGRGRDHTSQCLALILHIVAGTSQISQTFLVGVIAHSGLKLISNLLFYLCSQRREPLETYASSIESIFTFFAESIRYGGNQAIVLALEGRLLLSMVLAAPLLVPVDGQPNPGEAGQLLSGLYAYVFNQISRYLVYHKVSHLFDCSLWRIRRFWGEAFATFKKNIENFGPGVVILSDGKYRVNAGTAWQQLDDHSHVVAVLWYDFKANHDYGCSNSKCEVTANDALPARCVRCKTAFYCSRKCQKEDWRTNNHRARCNSVIESSIDSGLARDVTDLDMRFFRWMSLEVVRQHRKAIEEEAVEKFHSTLMSHDEEHGCLWGLPIIIADFVRYPAHLSVQPLKQYVSQYDFRNGGGLSPLTMAQVMKDFEIVKDLVENFETYHTVVWATFPAGLKKCVTLVSRYWLEGLLPQVAPSDVEDEELEGRECELGPKSEH